MVIKTKISIFILLITICFSANSQTTKKVLIEEITGTWCGLCPQGFVFMDSLMLNFENTIGVAMHQGDPMSTMDGSNLGNEYTGGGVPAFLIDRYLFDDYGFISIGTDYDLLMEKTTERLNTQSAVGVSFVEASLDQASNKLSVTLQADFFEDINETDMRFNLYVVEDKVVSDEPGYAQANYFNVVQDHPYGGEGPVLTNFEHRYVCRTMAGGAWGKQNSLPSIDYKRNDKFNYIFLVDIDPTWNLENVSLIGMVQCFNESNTNRAILNAEEISLATALNPPVDEEPIATSLNTNKRSFITVSPNPISQFAKIEFHLNNTGPTKIFVSNTNGTTVKVLRDELLNEGMHTLMWNTLDTNRNELPAGIYFINIVSGTQLSTKKIQLLH